MAFARRTPIFNVGNDIIRAYLGGVSARQAEIAEQNKVDFENEKLKQDTKYKQNSLNQARDEFNATHALHKALNDVAVAKHRAEIQRNFAETGLQQPGSTVTDTPDQSGQQNFEQLNQATAGMGPNQVREGSTAPSYTRTMNLDGVDYQVPDPFTFRKQQADLQNISNQPKVKLAGDIAGAQANSRLPSQMTLLTTKDALENKRKLEEFDQKKQIVTQQLASHESSAREVANIRANATLAAAQLKASQPKAGGIDPQELEDNATMNATGQAELPTGANKVHVTSILHQSGLVPIDKPTMEKIKSLSGMPDIFNKLDDFIDRNLADKKGFGPFGTYLASKVSQSDISSEMATNKLYAAPIARNLEGLKGRLTNQQLITAMDAISSASISRGEGHKRINSLRQQVANTVVNETLSNVPEKQRQMIIQANPSLAEFMSTYGSNSGATKKGPKDLGNGVWQMPDGTKAIKHPDGGFVEIGGK